MYSENVQYNSFSLGLSLIFQTYAVLCLCLFLLPFLFACRNYLPQSIFFLVQSINMLLAVPICNGTLLAYTVVGKWETEVLINNITLSLVSSLQLVEITFVIANFLISFLSNFAPPKMYFTSYLYVCTAQLLRIRNTHSSNLTQVSYNLHVCKALFLTKDTYAS